jgi:hypothetical protein
MSSRPIQLAVLFAAAALPAAFTLDPKLDHDTWWHLRVGKLVAETGTVPETDPFSRLGREQPTPWVAYSWLYEWGLYQTFAALGTAGVLWVRTLLGAASAAAVFMLLPNRGWRVLGAILAGVALMPLMKERPWHVTIAFTALTVWMVERTRNGSPVSRAWWLVPVFAVWANVHVQFVMGWLVLGLACAFPGKARRRSLILLTAGCAAATLCNPYFARLHLVIWEYATQTGPLRVVQELAPPSAASPWLWAGLALLGWAGVAAARRRPIDWFEVGLIAAALVLTLRMRRDVWFAAVAAGAVLRQTGPASVAELPKSLTAGVVVLAFVAIRLANLAGLGPPADTAAADARAYPVRAAAFVRDHDPPGPLFNSFDWGGYLIWALPEYPVSIDGRTNLYGSERVTRAMNTWAGGSGWDTDPELVSAKLVIAPRDLPLTGLLRDRPERWKVAYEDEMAVVFIAVGR